MTKSKNNAYVYVHAEEYICLAKKLEKGGLGRVTQKKSKENL